MPLGTEVRLDPGDIMLDGNPAPQKKRAAAPPHFFGPCLLWPHSWMDQDQIWHGGRPRSRPHCIRWRPSSPKKGVQQPAKFLAMSVVAKRLDGLTSHLVWTMELRLGPGHIALDGDPDGPVPSKKREGTAAPNLLPISVVAKRLNGSTCH